jgi:hypothetical protein
MMDVMDVANKDVNKGESYKFSHYKDSLYDIFIDVISANDG